VFGIAVALIATICLAAGDNVLLAVFFGALTLVAVASAARPPGVRVTAENQPELWAAVAETAGRVAVTPPQQVWLVHEPEVTLAGRRAQQLRIGLPLLRVLDEHAIRALLAHELAHRTFPKTAVVLELANTWRSVADARIDDDAMPEHRDTEAELRALGVAAEAVTDEAAVNAAGTRRRAAHALAVADQLTWTYDIEFLRRLGLPGSAWWSMTAVGLEDIDDIWQRVIENGVEPFLWDEDEAAEVATRHPPLADDLLVLSEADLTLTTPVSALRLHPLDQRSRRRLARRSLNIPARRYVRWYTVETAPSQWWRDRSARKVERLRTRAAAVLGRDPRDHVELAEVVLLRNEELMRVILGDTNVDVPISETGPDGAAEDQAATQPPVFLDIIEDALQEQGWRIDHPAVRGVLIGPHGERFDARPLQAMADSEAALAAMRAIVTGGAEHRPM
jgi:hypothetical protein